MKRKIRGAAETEIKPSQLHIGFNMGVYQNFLVKADTERLLEVLQNIIENAIKYGSGDGKLVYEKGRKKM